MLHPVLALRVFHLFLFRLRIRTIPYPGGGGGGDSHIKVTGVLVGFFESDP